MAGPLIIQSDGSILLDTHDPDAFDARDALIPFAELEKSPEHMHTYRLSLLSLWNAAQAGLSGKEAVETLSRFSRYGVPPQVERKVMDAFNRFGKTELREYKEGKLELVVHDPYAQRDIDSSKRVSKYLRMEGSVLYCEMADRGNLKLELVRLGWPANDYAALVDGEPLDFRLRDVTLGGKPFALREYQRDSARAFVGAKRKGTGFGTIVLPCGSGKTVVGMAVMQELKTNTLILAPNAQAVHQWIRELKDKSFMDPDDIGEYSGLKKEIKPVTVATYQIITWRPDKDAPFPHFSLFRERAWGMIIYDEVHMLPAPVFRVTAELQAVRRLGLTATLIREDGKEDEVFGLVGPKRYDVPWKVLEAKGFIAEAVCREIRLDLPENRQRPYAESAPRGRYRIAAENPAKVDVVRALLAHHSEEPCLVIGEYLSQLGEISRAINAPLVTGKTSNDERERIYREFREGAIRVIVASRVANFAIDLPDASVAIQVSGTFGSRQEEAQRLGRVLRPKDRSSFFYTLVTQYSQEEEFAANRQKFLAEQGYKYETTVWED